MPRRVLDTKADDIVPRAHLQREPISLA